MQARQSARSLTSAFSLVLLAVSLTVSSLALAAAPPLPPPPPPPPLPLPSATTPGGAQPVMPPPTIPIPETNLDLSVPPVYERPLGAEEGDHVFVKKFVITGVIGDRKAGINPADIQAEVDARFGELQKVIESQRLTKQNLENENALGFTPDEQDRINKFMQGAVKTQSADQQAQQYQQFIQELMLERLQRLQGLTIGQLQQVADVITKYYHDRGYFLARAVIPAQEIKDGVVNIRVLEGRLEKVQTSGNKRYSDKVLAAPFNPLVGELVTVSRTENALLTLSHYPGLSAAGVFRPGTDVGSTDIVVNVQDEKRVGGSARYDNSGTEFTGRKRLIGTFDWFNPTGGADQLSVTGLHSFGSESNTTGALSSGTPQKGDSTYGDLRYDHPLFSPYDRWAVDISHNKFDVAGALQIGGVSKIGALSWEHDFSRAREGNVIGTLDYSRKRADTLTTSSGVQSLSSRDDLAVVGYQLNVDSVNTSANTISTGYVRVEHGFAGKLGAPEVFEGKASRSGSVPCPTQTQPTKTCADDATPLFNKYTANYQIFKNLPANQGLLFRFNGQYSHNLLTSLEEYVMGGPDSVRAAPTSQFLVDRGVFSSLEYSVRAPGFADKHAFGSYTWGQVLRLRIFTDVARGWINEPAVTTTPEQRLEGTGIGLEFTVPGSLTADLQYAHLNGGARIITLNGKPNPNSPDNIKNSSETWFDLTYSF